MKILDLYIGRVITYTTFVTLTVFISLNSIINFLDLKKPIYYETSQWGAYGNGFKWDECYQENI